MISTPPPKWSFRGSQTALRYGHFDWGGGCKYDWTSSRRSPVQPITKVSRPEFQALTGPCLTAVRDLGTPPGLRTQVLRWLRECDSPELAARPTVEALLHTMAEYPTTNMVCAGPLLCAHKVHTVCTQNKHTRMRAHAQLPIHPPTHTLARKSGGREGENV